MREIPKSLQQLGWEDEGEPSANKRPHFCLQHVRLVNRNWNFFEGMNVDQLREFERDAITGHRPVRASNMRIGYEQIRAGYDKASRMRYGQETPQPQAANTEPTTLPTEIREALGTLDLQHPLSLAALKTAYRALAKAHHPDTQPKNKRKAAEEILKTIIHAYYVLKGWDGLAK